MPRFCKNKADAFCYICGEFIVKGRQRRMTPLLCEAYEKYFGCKVGDHGRPWAPQFCCLNCFTNLLGWMNGSRKSMPFAIPMVWREPSDHSTDCYFCLNSIAGMSSKTKKQVDYPNVPSAIRPVPHSDDLPVPPNPLSGANEDLSSASSKDGDIEDQSDEAFVPHDDKEPHLITQDELSDLIRDLNLTKTQSEILGSRLQQWNLLDNNTRISVYRKRQQCLSSFFSMEGSLCYCNNVKDLFENLDLPYEPSEWRLFIDGSKISLKGVLLHNGNNLPSIPVAYAVHMKESYQSMSLLLGQIGYRLHQWNICADFKVIALLHGMQTGYTKFCCFLCEWDIIHI